MTQPFLGQIEAFAFNFPPKGWYLCAGQTLSIQQNQALFSLLGTTYGGNGINNFNLPDLRGRVALGQGTGAGLPPYSIGNIAGEENHTLLLGETPMHYHGLNAAATASISTNVDTPSPTVALAQNTGKAHEGPDFAVSIYANDQAPSVGMTPTGLTGGQPHNNMMPYLAINYCIAASGIFPSRS